MSALFLNEDAVQELTDILKKTPMPVIMRVFEQVEETDIAVFLLLLDVATNQMMTDTSEEIRRTLEKGDSSQGVSEGTLTAYAQKIFAQFPFQIQLRVAEKLAVTEMVDTQQAEQIWTDFKTKVESALENTLFFGNGAKNIAKFLGKVDMERQNQLMEALEKNQPHLANTISDSLFTFEDIVNLPDEAILTLLQVLETNTLALALYNTSTEIQDRFFDNMSVEKVEMVETATEQLTFEQRQISETAQQSVVSLIRNFAAKGMLKIQ